MKRKKAKPKPIVHPAVKSLKKARKVTSDFHKITRQVSFIAKASRPIVCICIPCSNLSKKPQHTASVHMFVAAYECLATNTMQTTSASLHAWHPSRLLCAATAASSSG